jgi:hypothetical protein
MTKVVGTVLTENRTAAATNRAWTIRPNSKQENERRPLVRDREPSLRNETVSFRNEKQENLFCMAKPNMENIASLMDAHWKQVWP